MNKAGYLLVAAVAALIVILSSLFVVDERERALVLQFGQIQRVEAEPGLKFKLPFIQQVVRYDDRILALDTDPIEVTPADDRRLVVDAFARYRVADVVQLRQATGAGGLIDAERRLEDILNPRIRAVLGADGVTSNTILSDERAELMNRIRDLARIEARSLGLDVVDVRLKQTALPAQNLDATFARMRAEREREAADQRARGEEAAQRVRALADRTVVETVSEARRESEIARGEADADRNRIFAEAFGQDPDFFAFYRSLTAYERALQEGGTTMVLSPDSQFFDFLQDDGLSDEDFSAATRPTPAAAPVPEAPAEEDAAPAEETGAPAADDAPAEEEGASAEDALPAEDAAPAEEAGAPAEDAAPAAAEADTAAAQPEGAANGVTTTTVPVEPVSASE